MGKVIVLEETTKNPITLIGKRAGVCWGADISNDAKNYKRGIDCIESGHGRTFEYVNVELVLDGYSARVIREFYTHIAGSPTRLQASTRYIDYTKNGFKYVVPNIINKNPAAKSRYESLMNQINSTCRELEEEFDIPREDTAMCLPLGMETKIVDKRTLRSYLDMAKQRTCKRAYWEFRLLFNDIKRALSEISDEWEYLIDNYFETKCDTLGYCPEKNSCGRKPKKGDVK